MHCYYHPDRDAIGLCKACSRGICQECTADFEQAIACRHRQEKLVEALLLSNRCASVFAVGYRRNRVLGPLFIIVLGLLYASWGYIESGMSFTLSIGLLFAAFGVILLIVGNRAARQIERSDA